MSCPTCQNKYANRQNLKRHIKIHHNLRIPFSCDSCNIDFKKKHQLSAHMYIHTGIKAFSCEICSKEFVTLLEKKKHMRCHKNYKCSECPQIFKQWSKYQAHLKSDHESKEYICDICGRAFKQRTHIIRHIRIHDPSKVIQCPYENCSRFYSRNSNLKQHMLMKHEKITHDCSICNAKLSTKKKLQEHTVKMHKSEQKVRVPKTKLMGRKVRKDIGSLKLSTALQLSGLPATSEKNPVEETELVVVNVA
uniref:C2H2-type domain-containing protein n=1 Tax=Pectinophora gossypiella TaxID=13191 RepID=A0A1E1W5P4_PECGO